MGRINQPRGPPSPLLVCRHERLATPAAGLADGKSYWDGQRWVPRIEALSTTALVIGIFSLVLCFFEVGVVFGPIAAIMGFISRRRIASSGGLPPPHGQAQLVFLTRAFHCRRRYSPHRPSTFSAVRSIDYRKVQANDPVVHLASAAANPLRLGNDRGCHGGEVRADPVRGRPANWGRLRGHWPGAAGSSASVTMPVRHPARHEREAP